ncbi:aminoglycoside phosphotransferase family protein [Yinghuangia soli]|uniref:Aminoglycoside phosphotransferase family protein n=1 Tax=Yinghuangia soli TaxID=2908204 RepID=A0AA41Q5I6_9ACTN|nr:aminoglycoside phosphotransferase family protein [Yinghuangia soli]MCF2530769.1 aminoglycoside phosphotransferase family protein [Yinghuangia soli]
MTAAEFEDLPAVESGPRSAEAVRGGVPGEVAITAEVVRALVEEQHPDLAGLPVREVAGGWDNQMWRLGEELAVRMPRTERAPRLQLKERRWLPVLAPRLPLPVPVPVREGAASVRFPKPWTVLTWVPGEPLDQAVLGRGRHAADTLGGFLRALHAEAPADAPTGAEVERGGHPKDCAPAFEYFLAAVVPAGLAGSRGVRAVRAVWDDAVAAPGWDGPPLWQHGDLHPANVVVADGTLAGVVDFGELFAGDPAWDLAAAWILLPAGAAPRFFAAYGGADEATIRRARGLAALKSLFLILMGLNGQRGLPGGKPSWGPAGRAALDRVLADGGYPDGR